MAGSGAPAGIEPPADKGVPACVTVTVLPPMLRVAVRAAQRLLAATSMTTPLPEPAADDSRLNQEGRPRTGQAQPAAAVTLMDSAVEGAPGDSELGETA